MLVHAGKLHRRQLGQSLKTTWKAMKCKKSLAMALALQLMYLFFNTTLLFGFLGTRWVYFDDLVLYCQYFLENQL